MRVKQLSVLEKAIHLHNFSCLRWRFVSREFTGVCMSMC